MVVVPLQGKFAPKMTETYVKEEVARRTMVKVPLSNSFLEKRDGRQTFSESLGAGASLAPRTRQRISLGSENDWKFRLRSCQSWKVSRLSLEVVVPTQINKYRMRYVRLGRDNLRSHFVFRPRHAPEWLRPRFLLVVFLVNEEELTGKTFTTSLNTTNPNTHVKFIFLRTSPLICSHTAIISQSELLGHEHGFKAC